MIYLLDSNHAVAILNGDDRMGARLASAGEGGDLLAISTIALGELYFGDHSKQVQENLDRVNDLIIPNYLLYDFAVEEAEEFGLIHAELRAKGRPIPTADMQIAAVARRHRLTLLTGDAHFSHVSGLVIEKWLL